MRPAQGLGLRGEQHPHKAVHVRWRSPVTRCTCSFLGAPERQEGAGAAVPAHAALGLHLNRNIAALGEGLQANVSSWRPQPGHGVLTSQLLDTQLWKI